MLWLSHQITMGWWNWTPNSVRKYCSHRAYMVMLTTPLYSASAEERAIAACFLLDQQIGQDPRLSEYPKVDLRSMLSPTQSEFVKPRRFNAVPVA